MNWVWSSMCVCMFAEDLMLPRGGIFGDVKTMDCGVYQ